MMAMHDKTIINTNIQFLTNHIQFIGGKERLRNSILLPTLTFGQTFAHEIGTAVSRVCGVEMSYMRGGCGVTRW